MGDNLVTNNSSQNFSTHDIGLVQDANQAKVVATPGTDAAQVSNLRAQLEDGQLAASGKGVLAEYSA